MDLLPCARWISNLNGSMLFKSITESSVYEIKTRVALLSCCQYLKTDGLK